MIKLVEGDCLEKMKDIESGSIDMILADIPYGTTECKWDSIIPFEPMWEQLKRVIKKNGAIVMTASQPFTSKLILSNIKMFQYEWIWHKKNGASFHHAKSRPLNNHESIVVFSHGKSANNANTRIPYTPIMTKGKYHKGMTKATNEVSGLRPGRKNNIRCSSPDYDGSLRYPTSILKISNASNKERGLHPTQKPVALMEYLIKTYTNEGETVLDFTMGSGSTLVAAKNLNRNGIGIELDPDYFKIAQQRIAGLSV